MRITLSRKNSSLEVNRFACGSNYQYEHGFKNNLRTEAHLREDIYYNNLLSVTSMASAQEKKKKKITFSLETM